MSAPEDHEATGLKASATRVANSAMELLRTRLELASIELAEERERLYVRLGLLFSGVLLIVFGVLGVGALLMVYFWDTNRIAAVLAPTLVCIAMGMLLLQRSSAVRRDGGLPFAATLAELDKDRAAITAQMSAPRSTKPQETASEP